MVDKGRYFNTEKKSSSVPNRDFTRKHYEERSESQYRGEKRNSATSSSQEAGRPKASSSDLVRDLAKRHSATNSSQEAMRSKASSSDPARAWAKRNSATSSSQEAGRSKASSSDLVRKLDRMRISQRTDHQPLSGPWPTGIKFSREISRATSSSFSGRDARRQREYGPLLRTQGRRLRGGTDPEESSEHLEQFERIVDDVISSCPDLAEFVKSVDELTKKYI